MAKIAAVSFVATLAVLGLANQALSQGRNCGPYTAVVQKLEESYGETRRSRALATDNSVFEVYAALESGTWTILRVMPSGLACIMTHGEAYEEVRAEPAGMKL